MRYTYGYIFEYFKSRGYLLIDQEHKNTKDRVTIIDLDGYKYHISFDAFLWGEKKSNFIYKPEKFSKRNKYTYHNIGLYIEKNTNKFYLLGGEYISSQMKSLICRCSKNNHSWETNLDTILRGSGCPYCNGKIPSKSNNLSDSFPDILKEWDYNKNKKEPNNYTRYSGEKVYWICECGHSWECSIANRTFSGTGCPFCCFSVGEEKIDIFLNNNSIIFTRQKKFEDLKGLGFGYLRFDFCVYDENKGIFLLIEFQGEQHFEPIKFFGGEEKFYKQYSHDIYKRYYCLNNNINFLEIDYRDIKNIEQILEKELFPLLRREVNEQTFKI